jgi:hypothetical protein
MFSKSGGEKRDVGLLETICKVLKNKRSRVSGQKQNT